MIGAVFVNRHESKLKPHRFTQTSWFTILTNHFFKILGNYSFSKGCMLKNQGWVFELQFYNKCYICFNHFQNWTLVLIQRTLASQDCISGINGEYVTKNIKMRLLYWCLMLLDDIILSAYSTLFILIYNLSIEFLIHAFIQFICSLLFFKEWN